MNICVDAGAKPRRLRLPVLLLAALALATSDLSAGTLSDPAVDAYNVHVGTETFAGRYQFTTNTLLVETAQAITNLGSDIIKGYLGSDFAYQYRITLPSNVTNLVTLARDEPSCHAMLDMPFRHFVLWDYPFATGDNWWVNGYNSTQGAKDYREIYDLTCYLLTNYNNSGKTFYLGHWEGDWYLLPNYNTSTNPTPTAIQGMIDWINNRQQAVDDAKRATACTNVNVFNYTEVNRVRDAMSGNTNINERAINMCVPYETNLDCLSWSSYDGMDLNSTDLLATLNYMQSMLPTNKASVFPGQRIWVGEYGWGGSQTPAQQEPTSRAYIQRLLQWVPRFVLFWEIYDNETNSDGSLRNFDLIDSNDMRVPCWYLHNYFINDARLLTAQFKETNGRLPTDNEFGAMTAPLLSQPLPTPANLIMNNAGYASLSPSSVRVSGMLAQGVYGDDEASAWIFWGTQDGSTVTGAWQQAMSLGVNTNFNPRTFVVTLTNLQPNTTYYYRFYGSNANSTAWAPTSAKFTTPTQFSSSDFGSSMKITLAGYNGAETLMNHPVLIELSTNLPGFSYHEFASPNGGDLRFADSSGVYSIPHEIDEWNTNGISYVWVSVPAIGAQVTNNYIWAYWGNAAATNPPAWNTNGGTWSPNYDLVWHLKQTSFPFVDSTLQYPATRGTLPTSTIAEIGHGIALNGTSQYLDAGIVPLGKTFTLSAWIKLDSSETNIQTIWANKNTGYTSAGFALFVNTYNTSDGKVLLETGDGTNGMAAMTVAGVVQAGTWHHVAASVNEAAGTAHLFVDGIDYTATAGIMTNFPNQADLNLGRFTNNVFCLKGIVDEARIEPVARDASWISADAQSEGSPAAFASVSTTAEESPPLSVTPGAGALTLSWPGSAVGFKLFTATNLSTSGSWTQMTNVPVWNGSQWQVMLQPDASTSRFYRLQFQ